MYQTLLFVITLSPASARTGRDVRVDEVGSGRNVLYRSYGLQAIAFRRVKPNPKLRSETDEMALSL